MSLSVMGATNRNELPLDVREPQGKETLEYKDVNGFVIIAIIVTVCTL